MTIYVVDLDYSMTDKDVVLVEASSKEEAVEKVRATGTTAKYISVVRTLSSRKVIK